MVQGIIGRKLGMAQLFRENGTVTPVTVLEAGPCTVTQLKTRDSDGYNAVQLGFGKAKKLNSPEKGQRRGLGDFRYLREIRLPQLEEIAPGTVLDVSIFKAGDLVDITGVTKGKGFAGVVKRHHFKGGPKTRGQSDRHRAPGTIGNLPGHVSKGMRMAGHMGDNRLTVRNLEVLAAEPAKNRLLIKGAVPGAVNGIMLIRKAVKGK